MPKANARQKLVKIEPCFAYIRILLHFKHDGFIPGVELRARACKFIDESKSEMRALVERHVLAVWGDQFWVKHVGRDDDGVLVAAVWCKVSFMDGAVFKRMDSGQSRKGLVHQIVTEMGVLWPSFEFSGHVQTLGPDGKEDDLIRPSV